MPLADRPVVIEAVVDPAVALLPPDMPDAKADKVIDTLRGEPDGERLHGVSPRLGLDPGDAR